MATDATPEQASPEDWPWMPIEVRPLEVAPAVGSWVWTIPDRPRNSSFHEVVAIAMVPTDDGPVVLIESACGRAWPLELLAAAVEASHPVLDRRQDGTSAACSNCTRGGRAGGRRSQWDVLLTAHRAGERPTGRSDRGAT